MDWSYINGCKYQGLNYLDQPNSTEERKRRSEDGFRIWSWVSRGMEILTGTARTDKTGNEQVERPVTVGEFGV